jgi:hypothetical protein
MDDEQETSTIVITDSNNRPDCIKEEPPRENDVAYYKSYALLKEKKLEDCLCGVMGDWAIAAALDHVLELAPIYTGEFYEANRKVYVEVQHYVIRLYKIMQDLETVLFLTVEWLRLHERIDFLEKAIQDIDDLFEADEFCPYARYPKYLPRRSVY